MSGPRLSIGLSPQPDVLRGLASKPGFRGRGLLGRFLYLLPPSPLGYRALCSDPVPASVRAAYAAGLAVGYWPNPDALRANWQEEARFDPQMQEDERERLYASWRKAVTKSFDWVER